MKISATQKQKGFTLIELLLAVALFSIVVVISFGAIMTTVDVNRKSQTLTTVMNDLNFTLESMTRTIKTATEISALTPSGYVFKDQRSDDNYVAYRYDDEEMKILKCEAGTAAVCNGGSVGNYTSIVSDQIEIDNFILERLNGGDDEQPRFLMLVEGTAEVTDKISSSFSIQTTVSPRVVNFNDALY